MSTIKWDESLSVGVILIDEQHRRWIEHLHDVETAIASRRGMQQIASTLDFLVNYTGFHFSTEEKYMLQTGYPGTGDHKARHVELKNTLDGLVEDFREDGVTERLGEAIGTFLSNWLREHIRNVDLSFAAYLKDKKVQLT